MIWLIFIFICLSALCYMLLQKMKKSQMKDDSFWSSIFILLTSVLCFSSIASFMLLLSYGFTKNTFGYIEIGIFLFLSIVSTTTWSYISIEKIKYTTSVKKKSGVLLTPGGSYIIEDTNPDSGFKKVKESIAKGSHAMCIVRNNPKNIMSKYGLKEVKTHWLTEVEGEGNLHPTDLEELSYCINNFLDNTKNGIVLIEGLEYLANYNSFTKVLHLFQVIKDNVSLKKGILVLPINPKTFEPESLKLLETEFKVA
jgi:hypothetical protein